MLKYDVNFILPQTQFPAQSCPSSGPPRQASCTALAGLVQAPQLRRTLLPPVEHRG